MSAELLHLFHHMVCGGIAAAGFGVLFNIGFLTLPWCFAAGALALMVRTVGVDAGLTLEASSFLAAFAVGVVAQTLSVHGHIARSSLAVAGVIPMIPGSFAAKAIVALFALTAPASEIPAQAILETVQYLVRVTLIFGALGAGVAIPFELLRKQGR